MDFTNAVYDFHEKYNRPIDLTNDEILGYDNISTREDLISEETYETRVALDNLYNVLNDAEASDYDKNLFHAALLKELCDLVYVVIGTAVSNGYDFDGAFEAVHTSNMTKNGVVKENGKVTKGEEYIPPNLLEYVVDNEDE